MIKSNVVISLHRYWYHTVEVTNLFGINTVEVGMPSVRVSVPVCAPLVSVKMGLNYL